MYFAVVLLGLVRDGKLLRIILSVQKLLAGRGRPGDKFWILEPVCCDLFSGGFEV